MFSFDYLAIFLTLHHYSASPYSRLARCSLHRTASCCRVTHLLPPLTFPPYYYRFAHRSFGEIFGSEWALLDNYRGSIPWHHMFNLAVLRMLSFNLDYIWCSTGEEEVHPIGHYGLLPYVSYILYVPLYIAGPTTTFNTFLDSTHRGAGDKAVQESGSKRVIPEAASFTTLVKYGCRAAMNLLVLEIFCHVFYANAILQTRDYQHTASPISASGANKAYFSYWNLNFLWLKFLVIWRFFRFWSLCDGVDCPENMHRCMSNNYSLGGFWRSWHRSFNRWLVRYIYIPLGGSRGLSLPRRIFNILIVFTFVALWHDQSFQLLSWGWLLALFFIPELIGTKVSSTKVRVLSGEFIFKQPPLQQQTPVRCGGMLTAIGIHI